MRRRCWWRACLPKFRHSVVERTAIPVIGCGTGPACHGSVIVTHDALGLTRRPPRFAPKLADIAGPLKEVFSRYVHEVQSGQYPAAEHQYEMPAMEKEKLDQTS